MIEKQRLVQEQRNLPAGKYFQCLFKPRPLLGLGGLTVTAEQLCVDADKSPVDGLELPAFLAEVPEKTRASFVIHAFGHLAGDDVVADIVIARQVAAGYR